MVVFDGFQSICSAYSSAREKSDEFVHRCKKLHTKGPSKALRAFKYTPSPYALRRYDHREQKIVVASRRMHYRRLCAGKYAHSMCAPKKQNFEEEDFLSVA